MTPSQKAYLLKLLHSLPVSERETGLRTEIKNIGIPESNQNALSLAILEDFNTGIKNLNANQLKNIIDHLLNNRSDAHYVKNRLSFYGVSEVFHPNILQFFNDYIQALDPIDVGDLDTEFRGVQVASRDNFNTIINQGWTGDWDLKPDNITTRRVQVASMNEDGPFPRGYYLNADITKIQDVVEDGKIRHRIFIANPVIINTGNRNVQFIAQPVRYFR